ncbi:MAG: hypothetical protein Q7K13_07715 [Polynucleobacter sp.]|uniref:ApeA N-terminal domain 1-containing protein n=1 Tax=Polynucleobacter sp. TaxID=2029855 RepID=UPI002719821D|nr:HEPN domain-containing protein [Polynucleobacter sp.]MDO8714348.1 hypothetical protein [Polynucleobacter sp.]
MKKTDQFLGLYALEKKLKVVGQLRLKGPETSLKLHADHELISTPSIPFINGVAYSGEKLTLINCISPGHGSIFVDGQPTKYHAEIFPHHVAIGSSHLNPKVLEVTSIQFTSSDFASLFYDFDAFNHSMDPKSIIDLALNKAREMRPVESGDHPIIAYFTGKMTVIEVMTGIGKISVHHTPRTNSGGPSGVYIKNRIVVSIEFKQPKIFNEAMNQMYEVASFLSLNAGRIQKIKDIKLFITNDLSKREESISIYSSYPWRDSQGSRQYQPHAGDMPLDPIRRPEEFKTTLSNWIGRHDSWRVARTRYFDCLGMGNMFDAGRLISAANMFDLLPSDAIKIPTELSDELIDARDRSKEMFKGLPDGVDRNSVLNALGRLGKPSLPKKINYRVSVIEPNIGSIFPELQLVANTAVKCRNFFVHGPSDDFDWNKVESSLPFLTNALEFIFSASDLIEAGWDAQRWGSGNYGQGSSFVRFRADYDFELAELKRALFD